MVNKAVLALIAAALPFGAAPGYAQAAPFNVADQAFLAGMKGCLTRFEGIKRRQAFDDPAAFLGFSVAPEDRTVPGVRSLLVGVPNAQILKADLPASGGAVYVVIPRGGLPKCQTIATGAPGAQREAAAWLDNADAGWKMRGAEEKSSNPPMISRLYSRPFQADIGIGATLMWPTTTDGGSLTALSTMSLARD